MQETQDKFEITEVQETHEDTLEEAQAEFESFPSLELVQSEAVLYVEMDEEELPDLMELIYEKMDSIPKNEYGMIKGKLAFSVVFYPDN